VLSARAARREPGAARRSVGRGPGRRVSAGCSPGDPGAAHVVVRARVVAPAGVPRARAPCGRRPGVGAAPRRGRGLPGRRARRRAGLQPGPAPPAVAAVKLRFDPGLPHQLAAIDAVLELLSEQPCVTLAQALAAGREHGVVGNRLELAPEALLARVHAIQRRAGLPPSPGVLDEHGVPQVSVEMETGTGKTYVYLRTLLELARRHGLRKAVVVVPSVAVREGVLQTLRATAEHFAALLPGLCM